MTPKPENLITVLDAGSQKSCVLVAEVADGVLKFLRQRTDGMLNAKPAP